MATDHHKQLCGYRYDPLDRLASHVFSVQAAVRRFYQNDRLVTEIQGTGARSIMQHEGQLLAQQQNHGGRLQASPLATDLQRSVLSMLDATQPRPFVYTPYGHSSRDQNSLSMLGFTGERPELMTGHYLLGNGHRAFNPVLMRFNSPDALSPFGKGGLNAYAYCLGDPMNRVDPNGRFSFAPVLKAIEWGLGYFVTTRIGSTLFGNVTKPLKNFRTIVAGVDVFDDVYKNSNRLNVMAHGGIHDAVEGSIRSFSYMDSDNKLLSPRALLDLLREQRVKVDDYRNVRLLTCHSADAELPFAAAFANLTGKPVKAFSGEVVTSVFPSSQNIPLGAVDRSVKLSFVFKKFGLMRLFAGYKPKKFLPGLNVR